MRHLLRLFPQTWRDRYEVEFGALLEQSSAAPQQILDVLRYAASSHRKAAASRLRSSEGVDLGFIEGPSGRARPMAMLALLLTLPSALFAFANAVEYQVGVPGFASLPNDLARWDIAPVLLLGLPALGVPLALGPLLGLNITSRSGPAISARVILHWRSSSILVVATTTFVGSALMGYAVLENL